MVWNGGYFNAVHMARWASTTLGEYHKHHPLRTKKPHRTVSYWVQPPSGRLKINVDGSFLSELEQGSIGVVARDNLGNCIAALSRSLNHVSSALHAEAEACRAGLLLAIHQGWDDLIMETDCTLLVDALAGVGDDFSQIGRIVGDCREYLCSFNSFVIRHVYREANRVAHRLAHVASLSNVDKCWLGETPSIIEDVLFEDLCNLTRGSGFMSPSMYLSSVV